MAKSKIDTVCYENIGKPKEERLKLLKRTVPKIQKQHGSKDALFFGGDRPDYGIYERIPFGILPIDRATGGGVPKGLFTQIYGPQGGGKTTLCFYLIAQCQKAGGIAAYIDAEHRGNASWAQVCGVNLEELVVMQPESAEAALQGINNLCLSGTVDLVVVDSVVALATVAESTRELTDESIALLARKLSQFFRISTHNVSQSKTAVVFINQVRTDINTYGAPEGAPGGKALKHHVSLSVKVRRGSISAQEWSRFKSKDGPVGFPMFMKIDKSSVGHPGRESYSDFYEGSGIDVVGTLMNTAIAEEVISTGGGGYYSFTDNNDVEHRYRGRDTFLDVIRENEELQLQIEQAVLHNGEPTDDGEEDSSRDDSPVQSELSGSDTELETEKDQVS